MAKNSLFAVLLRSHWWISLAVAAVLTALALALLPADYRVVGAMSAVPFYVIAGMSAWRGRHRPSPAQVAHAVQAVSALAWPAFARLLEEAFKRDGYAVQRGGAEPVDFELERQGKRMLVLARRWKSARIGLESLRALQAAQAAKPDDGPQPHLLYIGLGELTDTARPFAKQHQITVWQAQELAQALRGLLPAASAQARTKPS